MKHKFLLLLAVLSVSLLLGCTAESKPTNYCAKCGKEATQTFSGPSSQLQSAGIPLSKCKKITSDIYTAYICSNCLGPVVELEP